jgi:hypothetical protein
MVRRFTSIKAHTADPGHQTDIILRDGPRVKYKLRLAVGSEETELQREDRTWTPAQRQYILYLFTIYIL